MEAARESEELLFLCKLSESSCTHQSRERKQRERLCKNLLIRVFFVTLVTLKSSGFRDKRSRPDVAALVNRRELDKRCCVLLTCFG